MTNARKIFVLSKRNAKISTQLGHYAAPPMRRCAAAYHSLCNLDTMLRRQRADAPQSAAAAAPVIASIAFLHVYLCLGAATAPSNIYNGCGCVAEVSAESHFGGCNHCGAYLDSTLIKCAGCNMRWCSDVYHRNNDNNDNESFRYGMEGYGHTQLVDVSSRDPLKQIERFWE